MARCPPRTRRVSAAVGGDVLAEPEQPLQALDACPQLGDVASEIGRRGRCRPDRRHRAGVVEAERAGVVELAGVVRAAGDRAGVVVEPVELVALVAFRR